MAPPPTAAPRRFDPLRLIERLGDLLPDPLILFAMGTLGVMVLSAIASASGWQVQPVRPAHSAGGPVTLLPAGPPVLTRNLLGSDGLFWLASNLVRNFVSFAPLGVVLVSMLGIGLAERVGLIGAVVRRLVAGVPAWALTPTVILLGILSHSAGDAGFVILPALAGTLFASAGKHPIAGLAAAYAGVAAGFSANLIVSPTDALIAPLTEQGARIIDATYRVDPACNWYFLAAAAVILTLTGWWVSARIVEPRLARRASEGLVPFTHDPGDPALERRGLRSALVFFLLAVLVMGAMIAIPGAPLHGTVPNPAPGAVPAARWSLAIVPMFLVLFLAPGLAYGFTTGSIRRGRDIADAFADSMRAVAPVIAVSFFAAQFVECVKYSQLDAMLAHSGGRALVTLDLPTPLLLVGVVVLSAAINMLMTSMSAKWTVLSLILVPMLMMVGLSPELTQAAYRVGDSVTNPVTPLNGYVILVIAAARRFRPAEGLGSVLATMTPYSMAFGLVWTALLLAWVWAGLPLGPGAPLYFSAHP